MTDRATSTTLSYVLTLSIATVLVGGLIVAGGTFVKDHREQVIRQELSVIGEHLAGNIDQVDRYARAGATLSAARIEQHFPNDVTGSSYTVKLADGGNDPRLLLNASQPQVSVSINVTTVTEIDATTSADGGRIVVACDVTAAGDCDDIEISND